MGPEELLKRRSLEKDQASPFEAGVRNVDAENGVDEARRGLMKLLLGGAAAAVISESALADAIRPKSVRTETIRPPQSPEQAFRAAKQRILDESVVATRDAIASTDVQDALRWRGENPISKILRAIELPILPAHLDDTTYDVSEVRRKYPVQMARIKKYNETNDRVVSSELKFISATEIPLSIDSNKLEVFALGNAFYFNDATTLVTCEHVTKDFSENAASIRNDSLDISVIKVSQRFAASSPDQIIHDDPNVTDADIAGGLVCVVGTDPDPLAGTDGKKVYPGVAIKLTEEFVQGAFETANRENQRIKAVLGGSYMIVIPPGEGRNIFPSTKGKMPASGMSGSAVYKNVDGHQRLVGIFWAAGMLLDAARHRNVDIAYFLPISAIREVVKKSKRWELK